MKHNTRTWSSSLVELQEEYQERFRSLEGDTEGRLRAQAYLNTSTARFQGNPISFGFLPKLYDRAAADLFTTIVKKTNGILTKMSKHFVADTEYRSLFRFSPLLEQLILLDPGYSCNVPIARFDIFLDEKTGSFTFCEINTDGTSAMNEDEAICNSLAETQTLQGFSKQHKVKAQELFDSWVEAFMDIYYSCDQSIPDPVVAIIDYTSSAEIEEQLEFRTRFERYGVTCVVADINTLEYSNGKLYARDVSKKHPAYTIPLRVDILYRRVVTYELLRDLEGYDDETERILRREHDTDKPLKGALALLAALVDKNACMIGSFRTQIAHSKSCFCLLHHPATREFLSSDEQDFIEQHIPFTAWLKPDSVDLDKVRTERERWIIKPVDGYATKGVHAGKSYAQAEWNALIDEKLNEDYIAQHYSPQYATLNTLPIPKNENGELLFSNQEEAELCIERGSYRPLELQPYNILTGLYSYAERFAGTYIRAGQDALIVGFRGGITMGSLLVDFEPQHDEILQSRPLTE